MNGEGFSVKFLPYLGYTHRWNILIWKSPETIAPGVRMSMDDPIMNSFLYVNRHSRGILYLVTPAFSAEVNEYILMCGENTPLDP